MGKKKGAKAQSGRAKQKQRAQRGATPRTTPRSRSSGVQQQILIDDDWEEDAAVHFRGFAQGTPSSSLTFSAKAKLRHQGISFVSAGVNAPIIRPKTHDETTADMQGNIARDDSEDDELEEEDIDDSLIQTNVALDADIESSNQGVANLNINTAADEIAVDEGAVTTETSHITITGIDRDESPDGLPFVVDTVGDISLANASATSNNRTTKRAPSPSPSNSSDEVVVFQGRNSKSAIVNDPIPRPSTSTAHPRTHETSFPVLSPQWATPSAPFAIGWGARPPVDDATKTESAKWTPAPDIPYWKKGKSKAVRHEDLASSGEEIKNSNHSPSKESKVQSSEPSRWLDAGQSVKTLQSDRKETRRAKKKGKDTETDFVNLGVSSNQKASRRKKHGRKKDNLANHKAITSDDDDMSEAAYEDYMENLRAQLEGVTEGEEEAAIYATLKASRHVSGPSMVVDGKEIGDDEFLPEHKEARSEDGNMQFKDESDWESSDEDLDPDFDELSSEDSELEDALEYSEQQQWEDEEDLRQRRIDQMSDEQMARLLAKQQELGMGADELLIEDGNYRSISDDGFGDVGAARAGLADISNFSSARGPNRHRTRGRGNRRDNFPNASAFADTLDQYGDNGFDIMDFDRPSLRPTKRDRKGKLPPELATLSDDELKESIVDQWEKDRGKKRQKKLEREELRMAGLLGSAGRNGKADLNAKYPLGMTMRNIHDELRAFLEDDDLRERRFPPMDKINRKALHEIAVALNLSSKSQGTGRGRFPIIYKNSRTGEYSNEMFGRIIEASSRGFLSNHSTARKFAKKGGIKGSRGGRGGGVAAASVRHGEIVGAGAAQIGDESFGHKMMLKMGWTKGKALGKDGEGLLEPVEQRMRVGTAGLG